MSTHTAHDVLNSRLESPNSTRGPRAVPTTAPEIRDVNHATENSAPGSSSAATQNGAASNDDAAVTPDLLMLPFTEARARALEEFDRGFITAALARNSGNIARTARALGLHRQSLQKLMARRGIKSIRPAPPER